MWDDWLRHMPWRLLASQKPWLLPPHFSLSVLWDCSSNLSQGLFSPSLLLTSHLTPGREEHWRLQTDLLPQMGGGTLIQSHHERDPSAFPCLNFCARTESTSLLPIPGLSVSFQSNRILISLALWDTRFFNACQKQLMVSFPPTCFQRRN